jgi:hypothetical protein
MWQLLSVPMVFTDNPANDSGPLHVVAPGEKFLNHDFTEYVCLGALERQLEQLPHTSEGGSVWMWSDGGMMISKVTREETCYSPDVCLNLTVCHLWWNPGLLWEASVCITRVCVVIEPIRIKGGEFRINEQKLGLKEKKNTQNINKWKMYRYK